MTANKFHYASVQQIIGKRVRIVMIGGCTGTTMFVYIAYEPAWNLTYIIPSRVNVTDAARNLNILSYLLFNLREQYFLQC